MPDRAGAEAVLRDGEERVARYVKKQMAHQEHKCDECGTKINIYAEYVRVQLVIEKPGEDLNDHHQARSVDFQRRVILKFHPDCYQEEDHG